MTTKEFIRRSDYYSLLNDCPYFNELFISCYRAQLVRRSYKSVSTRYVSIPTISCFGASELNDCQSIYFDSYTYQQFLIDMRFFKSFLNRLSFNQLESLKASGKCSNLLDFVSRNNNSHV